MQIEWTFYPAYHLFDNAEHYLTIYSIVAHVLACYEANDAQDIRC